MFKQRNRWVALGVLVALVAGTLMAGAPPVQAKSSTWKKVAIGGAVVAGYGLLKHKGKVATIGGLVAAGSYLKYRHDRKREKRRAAYYRNSRYRTSRYRNSSYRYAR